MIMIQLRIQLLTLLLLSASLYIGHSWAYPTAALAQDTLPPGVSVFDFNESNGQPLARGQIISSVTVDGLTMSIDVDSNGANDVGMIFDTNNPVADPDLGTPNEACPGGGPGVGAGGAPGTIGENCEPLGNVLIIPELNPVDPIEGPDDDSAGGVITLTFSELVRVLRIDLLDVDEIDSAPLITFLDENGNRTLDDVRPQVVGENGHEKFDDFSETVAASVMTIQITFPGSGALDSIIVAPADPGYKFRKFVNTFNANDPNGSDTPELLAGTQVTWTYWVTNTGDAIVPIADLTVTDSDPTVDPLFNQVLVGNADQKSGSR